MSELLLGYDITDSSLETITDEILQSIQLKEKKWLACLNPHSFYVAKTDSIFCKALKNADWLIPDGIGMVIASRWLKGNIRRRITGPDVFFLLNEKANQKNGLQYYFFGGSEKVLKEIERKMKIDYPSIKVVGTFSPPFGKVYSEQQLAQMIDHINNAKPDVLWVAMTAPKQEKWIFENLHRLNAPFSAAVGAVFDFYAGKVKRSPRLFRTVGLEWLPRLLQQPKRLWRRTFISAPVFLFDVIKLRLRGKRNG